ncbi:hypothetical protein AB0P00_17600 [Microbacterium sp. NPDC077057]|uniref:hypothetical protein n=1 Tax=Microbacterium sp. NPDC077057 TaxID=3154763 RepID=UPI0034149C42
MTAPAKIRREITRDGKTVRYVHVFCDACSYWHAFAWCVAESFDPAERHLVNVHGYTPEAASNARRQWEHNQKTKTTREERR